MGWFKILVEFWKKNLERNVKRISIGFGAFLIVIISTCTLPLDQFFIALYSAGISFSSMIIMSIFGKNGNGEKVSDTEEPEEEVNELYAE